MARGAEIEQHHAVVFTHKNIRRLDVAMQIARLVHRFQTIEQGHQHLEQLGFANVPPLGQPLLERGTRLVGHHHVGGVVHLKVARHFDHVRVVELGQGAGFLQELVKSFDEGFFVFLLLDAHAAARFAAHQIAGKIFLDCNLHLEVRIHRQIGDAKAADSQRPLDPVFLQHGARA